MLLSRAVGLAGVAAVLAGPVAAPAPGGVDLVPVLTSTPFGATGGQAVTHTIQVSGTGTGNVASVKVTFTTTVGLVGAAARASQGQCSVVDDVTVVCDLGAVAFPAAGSPASTVPLVTISGTVKAGSVAGTLVENLVKVAAADADASNNVASNAYLTPGLVKHTAAASSPADDGKRPGYLVPVIAGVLVLGVLTSVILFRRRTR